MISKNRKIKFEIEAKDLRRQVLKMIFKAKASHIASSFSILDILLYLYEKVLNIDPAHPFDKNRDRLILSKGWAAAALYVVLAKVGFFPKKWLENYSADGGKLIGIVSLSGVPGVEATTGSMGHGLPIGAGMALAGKMQKRNFKVFVILSDGELDEGSTWEAILFAGHHKLDNLIVIIDYNKFQAFGKISEVLDIEPIADKFKAFRWSVYEVQGHDFLNMDMVFSGIKGKKGKPIIIIAHTIKGKGVSFMENRNDWHYRFPDEKQFKAAFKELS